MYYFHKKYSFSHFTAFFPTTIFFRSYSDSHVWSYHNTRWTFLDTVGLKSALYDSHIALKKKEVTVGIRNVSQFSYCRLQHFLPPLVSRACPECLVFPHLLWISTLNSALQPLAPPLCVTVKVC